MTGDAVAWAESPLQLLCIIEAHHAGVIRRTAVVPRQRVTSLVQTASAAVALGLPPGLSILPPRRLPPLRGARRGTAVHGDPFSGVVQAWLAFAAPRAEVVVDDGLISAEALLALSRGGLPLVRPTDRLGWGRRRLAASAGRRLARLARGGRLTVATALPIDAAVRQDLEDLGARFHRIDFSWLRSRPADPAPPQRRIVLGTSLVADGLVHEAAYLTWFRGLAAEEPIAYFPHRRETPATLAEVERTAGVTLHEPGPPVELRLRGLGPDHEVVTLPSSAAVSLGLVLAAAGTAIRVVAVPGSWWTEDATPAARAQLQRFVGGDGVE